MNFRHLHVKNDELLKSIFESETNPIIVIDYAESTSEYHNKLEDKINAIKELHIDSEMLFVWEGKIRTDVFELKEEDIDRIINLFQ